MWPGFPSHMLPICSNKRISMVSILLDEPKISIVVPVHNGGESFRRCLSSIQCWGSAAEVIVVADGDSDGSWKIAEACGFKVVRLPESKGPANARNVGAESASADILFFIDADVELHPTTLARVLYAFRRQPELAALIGSYDDEPGAENFLSQYKNLFHHYTHQEGKEEASTFWGACGAIRRDIFLEMGGFDQRYRRPCIEDIELGYRLRQAGYNIRLCKCVQVKHLKRWTSYSLLRAEVFYRALPWMALLLNIRQRDPEQYQAFTSDLNLKRSSRFSITLVYGLCLSLVLSFWWPLWLWIVCICGAVLTAINWPVYRFFYRKRGGWFALRVLPWHWLYYFYSGLAFVVSTVRHYLQQSWLGGGLNKKKQVA